jgi:DNA-binding MarR family transcriptional regulator
MVGEAFAMPSTGDSLAELRRGLAALASRERQRQYMARLVEEANVSLAPLEAWVLVRIEQDSNTDPIALARSHAIDPARVDNAANELLRRGLLAERRGDGSDGSRRFGATPAGCEVLGKIIAVRRAHVANAAAEWGANHTRDDLQVRRLQRELVPEAQPTITDPPPEDGRGSKDAR